MAKRRTPAASTIPAPTNLQVLKAGPDGVLLQWEHPGFVGSAGTPADRFAFW